MSLIALRQVLRRQGRRVAMLVVALALTPLAAHHAGVPDAGAGDGPAHHQMASHDADAPATSLEQATEVCLAILPLLLAATLALGLLPRHWFRAAISLVPAWAGGAPPRRMLRPPRDGPAVFCVMRC